MNHINAAYDRDKWQAVREISRLAEDLLASEDGLSFLELVIKLKLLCWVHCINCCLNMEVSRTQL